VLDADRRAICPNCGTRVHCGTIRLANLEKCHQETKTCIEVRSKCDKEAAKQKNGSLLTFFQRPKVPAVPSKVPTSMPVHGYKMAATTDSDVSPIIPITSENNKAVLPSESMPMPKVSTFLNKLQHLIEDRQCF